MSADATPISVGTLLARSPITDRPILCDVLDWFGADRAANEDENALFEDPATHKALTAMRLQGKRHKYVTSHVSNPLADPTGKKN